MCLIVADEVHAGLVHLASGLHLGERVIRQHFPPHALPKDLTGGLQFAHVFGVPLTLSSH